MSFNALRRTVSAQLPVHSFARTHPIKIMSRISPLRSRFSYDISNGQYFQKLIGANIRKRDLEIV